MSLFYEDDLARLVAFLVVQGARPAVAAEIAQDVLTEAYRHWDTIDSPKAWVRTVAARRWWRQARTDQRETQREDPAAVLLSEADSAEIENRHTFLRLLHELPNEQREIMAWTYDGYQPTEIAALLGRNPATVRSLLRDARAALQKRHPRDEVTS